MVGDVVIRGFAGGFCLGDNADKVVPFGVTQQMLQVSGQPEFHAVICLLSMALEVFSQCMNQFMFHFKSKFLYRCPKPGVLSIAGQNALDGAGVVSAEQDAVHQQWVKVVEIAAQLEETRRQGAMFAVAREKGLAEGVEQG